MKNERKLNNETCVVILVMLVITMAVVGLALCDQNIAAESNSSESLARKRSVRKGAPLFGESMRFQKFFFNS